MMPPESSICVFYYSDSDHAQIVPDDNPDDLNRTYENIVLEGI